MRSLPHLGRTLTVMSIILSYHESKRTPDARITPRIDHQVLIHPSHVLVPPRVISQELSLLPANMLSLPHLGRTLTVMSIILSYHESKRTPDARITPRINHQVLIHPPPSHVLVPPRVISQELSLLPANMPSLPHLGRTLTVMSIILSYHESKRTPDARITPRIDHQVLIHPPPGHVLVPPRVSSQ